MPISKKLRFEVFKRDAFTCQYCGHKAPDVVLQVDHIKPRSKGGADDILNLVTSCFECNSGKSNRELSDQDILHRKRKQLEDMQARKEQLEMMFEWQTGLLALEEQTLVSLEQFWSACVPGYSLTESGRADLKKLNLRFDASEITEAMRVAARQYLDFDGDRPTKDSVNLAFKRVGGICHNKRLQLENPDLQRLFYIRGILRKRLSWFDAPLGMQLLRRARELGATLDSLEVHAKEVRNWSEWRATIEDFIGSREAQ